MRSERKRGGRAKPFSLDLSGLSYIHTMRLCPTADFIGGDDRPNLRYVGCFQGAQGDFARLPSIPSHCSGSVGSRDSWRSTWCRRGVTSSVLSLSRIEQRGAKAKVSLCFCVQTLATLVLPWPGRRLGAYPSALVATLSLSFSPCVLSVIRTMSPDT